MRARRDGFFSLVRLLQRADRDASAMRRIYPGNRRRHVEATASLAVELAARYGYRDAATLERAALWHDAARGLGLTALAAMRDWFGWPPDDEESAGGVGLLHGPAGAAAATAAGLSGEAAAAIRYHVTGRPDLAMVDKILMVADATEPTRSHPWADEARAALGVSLDLGVAFWVLLKTEGVKARGAAVHPRALATLASFDAALVADAERRVRPFAAGATGL